MPNLVRLKDSAVEDLAEAYDWYETQQVGLGDKWLDAVGVCLDSIERHPRGNAVAYKDCRQALVKPFPYSVFYQITDQGIVVRGIFHHSRKSAAWRKRLKESDDR